MTARIFSLLILLSLVGRATSFSASPADKPPPPPRKLKAPPRDFAIPFLKQIKRSRTAEGAIRVITNIERDGYHPNMFHYSAIISKCAKEKKVKAALGLLKRMINQGVAPDVVVFGSVIDACANDGQYRRAIMFLNEMEEKYGVKPNLKCFSAAISACEKAAKWEEAVKLLRKMTDEGVEPNVVSYSSVISACEKCAEWEMALKFLNEMKEMGIEPDVTSYSSAISACEKGGQADVALSLLAEMKAEGIRPDVVVYSSAITACEKGGVKYTDTALSLFNEMKEATLKPDDVTYRAITKACFDSNRYSEALKKAREAVDLGMKNNGQPMHIGVSTENGLPMWDLQHLTEAFACMLLSDALINLVATNSGPPPKLQDVMVRSNTGKGQVLREKVPTFLNNVAGLETTAIEGNEGRFLITAASLEEWVTSGAYDNFHSLFST